MKSISRCALLALSFSLPLTLTYGTEKPLATSTLGKPTDLDTLYTRCKETISCRINITAKGDVKIKTPLHNKAQKLGNISSSYYNKKGFLTPNLTFNGPRYDLGEKGFSFPFQITGQRKDVAALLLHLINDGAIQEHKKRNSEKPRLIQKENQDGSVTVFVFKDFEQISSTILGLSDTMTSLARERFPQQQELENQLADAILNAGFPAECSTSLFKWILRLFDKSCETLTDHEGEIDLCGDGIKDAVFTTIDGVARILLSRHPVVVNERNYQIYLKNLTDIAISLLQDRYATFLIDSTSKSGTPDATPRDIQCTNALIHLLETQQLHKLTRDIVQKIGKGKLLAAEPLAIPTDDIFTRRPPAPVRTPAWDQDAEIVPIMDAYVEKLQTLAATKEEEEADVFDAQIKKILKKTPKQDVVPGEAVHDSSTAGVSGQTDESKS